VRVKIDKQAGRLIIEEATRDLEVWRVGSGLVIFVRGVTGAVFFPETPEEVRTIEGLREAVSRTERVSVRVFRLPPESARAIEATVAEQT